MKRTPIKRPTKEKQTGAGKKIAIAVLALILLLAGGAWAMGFFKSTDRAVAEVTQLQNKLAEPGLKDEERRALWREMREKLDALPPDAREQTWDGARDRFEKRMNDHMKEVLAMSKAEQQKALDADIDRMQRFEQMRQANAAADSGKAGNNQQGNRANRQRGGYRSDSDRIAQQKKQLDRSTPQVRTQRLPVSPVARSTYAAARHSGAAKSPLGLSGGVRAIRRYLDSNGTTPSQPDGGTCSVWSMKRFRNSFARSSAGSRFN